MRTTLERPDPAVHRDERLLRGVVDLVGVVEHPPHERVGDPVTVDQREQE